MKKLLLIAGGLFLVGAILFVSILFMIDFDFMKLGNENTILVSETITETFTNIQVDSVECDVVIRLSRDGTCKLEGTTSKKMPVTVQVKDGTLQILQADQRKWYDFIGIFNGNHTLTLYLPQADYEKLTVHCTTGDISVAQEFSFEDAAISVTTGDVTFKAATRNLSMKSTTGDISVSDIHTEGSISIKATTGHIHLKNTVCGKLSAKTTTGDITLESCDSASITMETTTGDVKATLLSGKVYDIKATTGDISVPAQDRSGGDCKVRATTGDITITVK